MITIQNGTLEEFFDSAMETAAQIDTGEDVTPKHTIWMETQEMLAMLKPQRTELMHYLKGKTAVYYSDLLKRLGKSPSSLNKDLDLLSHYQLIDITKEPNAGHGIRKVIRPLYRNETLEFRARV